MRHLKWLTTTDHKTIGTLYLVTSFAFFVIGGQTTEAAAAQQPPKQTRVRVHRAWFVAAVTFV
ncbi:hypothetical protein ABZ703_38990, partial [Streptomyces massasporeus]|uniref:hypothetical protein n=1 Tax=Streptomyces massasporeus TaxID=67324 RepID=UPI0033F33DC3